MEFIVPPGLPPSVALLLVLASAATSAISGALGIGGGVMLLAVMAPFMPVSVLIPVHGVVQLGSNIGRAALLARHAALGLIGFFLVGAVVGAIAGASLVTDLPEAATRLAIGLFVIWSAFGRVPALPGGGPSTIVAGGLVSTLLTMFVGATGPFVMALFKNLDILRQTLVSTVAVSMAIQHALKIAAFTAMGVAFSDWLGLAAIMIAAGFAGTYVGTRILKRLPERLFRLGLALVLFAIGVQLTVRAAGSLLGWWA